MLTTDLDRLVNVPHPSPQVAEPIWERVKPMVRTYPSGRLTLAAAGALGLACGLAWWRFAPLHPAPPTAQEIASIQGKKAPDDPVRPPVVPGTERMTTQDGATKSVVKQPAPRLRHPLRWGRVRDRSRSEIQARRSHRRPSFANPLRDDYSPERLRASGLMYEARGDPGLANVAYQAAYEQRPSGETAFDVGRTAEESGDMEQAMNVYAGLLESADARGRDQKGWTP